MAHLSTARNIISSCQISSHLIKIIATFIVIINSVIFTGAITILHPIRASLASRGGVGRGGSGSDQTRNISSEKITHGAQYPHRRNPIRCFNATDILFPCLDILTPANPQLAQKWPSLAVPACLSRSPALHCFPVIVCTVSEEMKRLFLQRRSTTGRQHP